LKLLNTLEDSIRKCYYQEEDKDFKNNKDLIDKALLDLENLKNTLIERKKPEVKVNQTYQSKFLEYKVKVIKVLDNREPEVVYEIQNNKYSLPTDVLYQELISTFKDRFKEI